MILQRVVWIREHADGSPDPEFAYENPEVALDDGIPVVVPYVPKSAFIRMRDAATRANRTIRSLRNELARIRSLESAYRATRAELRAAFDRIIELESEREK